MRVGALLAALMLAMAATVAAQEKQVVRERATGPVQVGPGRRWAVVIGVNRVAAQ